MKPDTEEEEALARLREWTPGGNHAGDALEAVTAVAPYTELGGVATRVDRPNAVTAMVGGIVQSVGNEQTPRATGQMQQDAGSQSPGGQSIPSGLEGLGNRNPGVAKRVPRPPEPQYGGTHYQRLNPEPIEVIEAWGLGFTLGNVLKYIARAGHKSTTTATEDLTKARWYINRALAGL